MIDSGMERVEHSICSLAKRMNGTSLSDTSSKAIHKVSAVPLNSITYHSGTYI